MNGSKDIVNFLIQNKINISSKDKQNKTAIEYANENKQEEVVSMLIEMWPKQTKLPLPPNVANIKNRIEEEKRRKQKEEEEKIRKQKEEERRKQKEEEERRKQKEEEDRIRRQKELKEFVDELGLPSSNSNQIFELLSKEDFDVEILLNTPKQDLERIFEKIKIAFGTQAKIFTLIETKKKVKRAVLVGSKKLISGPFPKKKKHEKSQPTKKLGRNNNNNT